MLSEVAATPSSAEAAGSRGGGGGRGGAGPGDALRLVLWRHGQTTYNAEHRFQGQLDVPLNSLGRVQAERAAKHLSVLAPSAIWSSDLSRATGTATYLARLTGLDVQLDKDLRERHGGLWEGLTIDEIRQKYPEDHAAWEPPGGESVDAVADRTAAALGRIAERAEPGSLVVVVGHGASLTWGMSRLLGLDDRVTGGLANCCWCLLSRRNAKWRLLEYNVGALPEPVEVAELGDDD